MTKLIEDERPLDRSPYYANHREHLDRVLDRPQLTGIGVSGCIGVGIFLTSGQLITASGSLGGPLSYMIAGIIAACVLYTLTEMVASRPLTGALVDLPHHFLDPAAGFAVAASYSLANIFSMATLTAYSAEVTALLKDNRERHSKRVEVGINIAFIALTTITHCLGVKLYGKIERVIMIFKLCLFVLCCILMIVVNAGGAGPRTGSFRGNYTTYAFPPGFKPTGFKSTDDRSMYPSGVPDAQFGLSGDGGRLFGFLTAVTLAMFSCLGGEMTAMTAGESKEPWKDVPVVMSFVYLIPLAFYPFVLMSAAANVNYADPSLPIIWGAGDGSITLSPFVVAIQTSALRSISRMLHFFFIVSAYTAGNTALYVASRSVFMLAQTYLHPRLAEIFGTTNAGHTPHCAILLCSAFGFISLTGLGDRAYSQPRQTMSAFYTGSIACVYICECVTFLKFRAGLKRLELRKILSRDDDLYISRMFKSRWQPLPAYIGIAGCSLIIIWSGVPALWILCSHRQGEKKLKSNVALGCDVLGAWIGPLIFVTLYLTYKYILPGSFAVDIRNLTPSDYVLSDLSLLEGENPSNTSTSQQQHTSPLPVQSTTPHQFSPTSYAGSSRLAWNSSGDDANIELGTYQYLNQNYHHTYNTSTSTAAGPAVGIGINNLPISPVFPTHANTNATFNLEFDDHAGAPESHPQYTPHINPYTHTPHMVYTRANGTEHTGDAATGVSNMDVNVEMDSYMGAGLMTAEIMEELEAQRAREEERARIEYVLQRRPRRMERSLGRELWSCIVAD